MAKTKSTQSGKTKPMGMYLQDPTSPELHEDYLFPLDRDFLFGTGSSRFLIRDADEHDLPLSQGLWWEREDQDLSFDYFNKRGTVDNPQFHQVNAFAVLSHNQAWIEYTVNAYKLFEGEII